MSLMASGITDSSLTYHLQNAKAHGEIPIFNVTFEPSVENTSNEWLEAVSDEEYNKL